MSYVTTRLQNSFESIFGGRGFLEVEGPHVVREHSGARYLGTRLQLVRDGVDSPVVVWMSEADLRAAAACLLAAAESMNANAESL